MDIWKLLLRIRADRDRSAAESSLRALGASIVWCQPSALGGEVEALVDLAQRVDPPAAASAFEAAGVRVVSMTRVDEVRGAA